MMTAALSTVRVALSSRSIRYIWFSGRACSNVTFLFQSSPPTSDLLGSVACAVVRPPVFLREAPAFQVEGDSPKHLRGNEARFAPRLGAIDQRADQYPGFLRRERFIVDRVSHLPGQ